MNRSQEQAIKDAISHIGRCSEVKSEAYLDSDSIMFGDHNIQAEIERESALIRRLELLLDVL